EPKSRTQSVNRRQTSSALKPYCPRCRFARRAVFVLTFMIVVLIAVEASAQEPALVRVDEVKSEPLTQTVPVIGRLVARQTGNVAARIAGPVEKMRVEVGDRVEAGQIIAVLNAETVQAELVLTESEYEEALAQKLTAAAEADLAKMDLKRQEGLRASAAFSQAKFEDAEKKVAVEVAKVKSANAKILIKKAAVARKQLDVEYAYVKSPYAGVILQRFTENGAYVRTGDPLVKIISDQNLELEADVPATRIKGLPRKRSVRFELDDGSRHVASVRAVLPSENPLTRTRTVRFVPKFEEPRRSLAEGQSVTIDVPVGVPRDVVTVHKDGVLRRQGRDIVYVIRNNSAELRTITIGESVGNRFEVLSGLKAGEQVVIRGNERLLPGAKVQVEKGST
ncbi:MAG: efflux RND transporter periplasmic adaptor subunit, partial [Methyloligellaceae bacterium]